MPAVPFIISFIVEEAIGAAVLDAVGSAILAKAITGSVSGAISAGVQGGDAEEGAKRGFVSGGVSAGVGEAVGGTPSEIDPVTGVETPATGIRGTEYAEYARPISRGAGTAAGTLATGGTAKQAIVGGLVTGGLDVAYGDTKGDVLAGAEKAVIGRTLTDYFAPAKTRSAQTVGGGSGGGGGGDTAAPEPTSVTTTGAGQAPGSQALSQALRIGDPGAPVLGSSDAEEGDKESGWNVSSLRYMGQES
jgi:hypothetical protein